MTAVLEQTRGHEPATWTEEEAVSRHFLRRGCGLEFEMEARWVRTHLPTGYGRILDLGCGKGSLFEAIGPSRALGVDFSARGLRHTRREFPTVPLLCAAAESLPLAEATLDGLILQHVIEHLSNPVGVCRELYRLIQPGGVLLLLTPNAEFHDWRVFDDPTHVHIYSRRELMELLVGARFEITDLRSIGLSWFRNYHAIPSGWRLRQQVTKHAVALSKVPRWRWTGQTLCCAARRPLAS